jgi:uncharacterized membrane-anchored protein YitT (DUF2179 family)
MRAQLVGLDSIEIVKYFQMVTIANVISTFYYALILGVGVGLGAGLEGLAAGREPARV